MTIFTFIVFVVPIVLTLMNAIKDPEVSTALPRTSELIGTWTDYSSLPSDKIFKALVADLKDNHSQKRRAFGAAARRLNNELSGFRSLFLKTARKVGSATPDANSRKLLTRIDARWSDTDTWAAVKKASPRFTAFYMLSALDLRRTLKGEIVAKPAQQRTYLAVVLRTLKIAGVIALACVLLGYPLAALMVSAPIGFQVALFAAVLLPLWTSLLAKTSAWIVILQDNGPINRTLEWAGLISSPIPLIFNATGVYIVMVHMLLPFTVLPIYSTMKSIPANYMMASASLGAHPVRGFFHVYLPITLPGISAGAILTFIVAAGYYITPSLVGSPKEEMVGYFIAYYAYTSINWSMASALSLVLLVAVLFLYITAGRLVGIRRIAGLN